METRVNIVLLNQVNDAMSMFLEFDDASDVLIQQRKKNSTRRQEPKTRYSLKLTNLH
jgi:hypothetical protein